MIQAARPCTRGVRTAAISLSLITATSLAGGLGCHSRKDDMKQGQASSVSHDAHVLAMALKLPATPLEVAFEEVPVGTPGGFGPTDYRLVAVIRFDAGITAALTRADAGAAPESVPVADLPWFPDVVKAKLVRGEQSRVTVRGRVIDGEAMFRPRYSTGSAVLVEGTDYILLMAQTS